MARAGLQDRVKVLLCDYRDLRGEYDKLVSVEMIEAVGQRYLPAFFRTCQARLRPGGKMALQAITIQDQRYRDYSKSVDFIQRYIFPGGFLPSITAMSELMTRHTDFVVRNLFDMGPDYARTPPTGGSVLPTPGRILKSSALMSASAGCGSTTSATAKPDLTPAPSAWCSSPRSGYDTPGAASADGPRVRCLLDAGGDVARARSADLADAGHFRLAAVAGGQSSARPAVGRGGLRLDACWALAGLIDFRGDSLLPLWMVALWLMFAVVWTRLTRTATLPGWVLATAATVGGPVAYLIGARLGAMTLLVPTALGVAAMACGWLVLMLLFHLGMGRQK